MSRIVNLIGQRFGLLLVESRTLNSGKKVNWLCSCDCGKKIIVLGDNLKSKNTKSCGCLFNKHGHSWTNKKPTKTYNAWVSLKGRCLNPKDVNWKNYGGRGIKIEDSRWLKFENFLVDMGECPKGMQIDRINNSYGYCKENCHYVTPKQNSRNRRNNYIVTFNGKTACLSEHVEDNGLVYGVVKARINHNWSIEKALTTPVAARHA